MQPSTLISLFKSYCCSFYGSHLWKYNLSGFHKCCKSWNFAVSISLGLLLMHMFTCWTIRYARTIIIILLNIIHIGIQNEEVMYHVTHNRPPLYVRNFRFLWNAFRLQNYIVSKCMDMALDHSNTCIGYKLAFYRYMYSIDIYHTINFKIKQFVGSNINDEQIAIVNKLSTLLSVRSGNNYINDFTLIEVNDLINYLSIM